MRTPLALLLVVAALGLAGCGGEDEQPAEEPPAAQPPAASATGPGITIRQARISKLEGPLLVRGSLHYDGKTIRLCSALAESYPPQCGGPSLVVEGLDLSEVEGLQNAQGVAWTDREVKLLGTVDGEVLRLSDTATA